jgi:hypothetical protein
MFSDSDQEKHELLNRRKPVQGATEKGTLCVGTGTVVQKHNHTHTPVTKYPKLTRGCTHSNCCEQSGNLKVFTAPSSVLLASGFLKSGHAGASQRAQTNGFFVAIGSGSTNMWKMDHHHHPTAEAASSSIEQIGFLTLAL